MRGGASSGRGRQKKTCPNHFRHRCTFRGKNMTLSNLYPHMNPAKRSDTLQSYLPSMLSLRTHGMTVFWSHFRSILFRRRVKFVFTICINMSCIHIYGKIVLVRPPTRYDIYYHGIPAEFPSKRTLLYQNLVRNESDVYAHLWGVSMCMGCISLGPGAINQGVEGQHPNHPNPLIFGNVEHTGAAGLPVALAFLA